MNINDLNKATSISRAFQDWQSAKAAAARNPGYAQVNFGSTSYWSLTPEQEQRLLSEKLAELKQRADAIGLTLPSLGAPQ